MSYIFSITKKGYGILFEESDVKETNRGVQGVQGQDANDEVVANLKVEDKEQVVTISTKNGLVARIPAEYLPVQKRGGRGIVIIKVKQDDEVVSVA